MITAAANGRYSYHQRISPSTEVCLAVPDYGGHSTIDTSTAAAECPLHDGPIVARTNGHKYQPETTHIETEDRHPGCAVGANSSAYKEAPMCFPLCSPLVGVARSHSPSNYQVQHSATGSAKESPRLSPRQKSGKRNLGPCSAGRLAKPIGPLSMSTFKPAETAKPFEHNPA